VALRRHFSLFDGRGLLFRIGLVFGRRGLIGCRFGTGAIRFQPVDNLHQSAFGLVTGSFHLEVELVIPVRQKTAR
jgi:hypothetical protein